MTDLEIIDKLLSTVLSKYNSVRVTPVEITMKLSLDSIEQKDIDFFNSFGRRWSVEDGFRLIIAR